MEGYDVFPLIINSTDVVQGSSNSVFSYKLPGGGIQFPKGSKVAVSSVAMFYSWGNISSTLNNNKLSYIWPTNAGTTTYNITIPDGYYNLDTLNSFLQQVFINNNTYLVDNTGNYVYYIQIQANSSLYSTQINCFAFPNALPTGWSNPGGLTFPATATTPQLVVPNNNIQYNLGINPGTYPSPAQSTNYSVTSSQQGLVPQITPVQSIIMTCGLLNNRMSVPNTLLFTFSPAQGTGYGSLIYAQPSVPYYVTIQPGNYQSVDIQFYDQTLARMNILDPNTVITLLIATPQKL